MDKAWMCRIIYSSSAGLLMRCGVDWKGSWVYPLSIRMSGDLGVWLREEDSLTKTSCELLRALIVYCIWLISEARNEVTFNGVQGVSLLHYVQSFGLYIML